MYEVVFHPVEHLDDVDVSTLREIIELIKAGRVQALHSQEHEPEAILKSWRSSLSDLDGGIHTGFELTQILRSPQGCMSVLPARLEELASHSVTELGKQSIGEFIGTMLARWANHCGTIGELCPVVRSLSVQRPSNFWTAISI